MVNTMKSFKAKTTANYAEHKVSRDTSKKIFSGKTKKSKLNFVEDVTPILSEGEHSTNLNSSTLESQSCS